MLKDYIVLLLLGHILGDFYLQTNKMAENKNKDVKYYILHIVFYSASVTVALLPIWTAKLIPIVICVSLSHVFVDSIKIIVFNLITHNDKNEGLINDKILFFADQFLHVSIIIITAIYMVQSMPSIPFGSVVTDLLKMFEIDCKWFFGIALLFLINAKPCNIFIKKILNKNTSTSELKTNSVKGAGASIGTLERWIIVLCFLMSQYSLIGLVLTAKSIARYNKISENEAFAEYYLLGTLISTIYAIVSSIILKQLATLS